MLVSNKVEQACANLQLGGVLVRHFRDLSQDCSSAGLPLKALSRTS